MAQVDRLTLRSRIGLRNGWLRQREGVAETVTGTTDGGGSSTTLVDSKLYSTARDQFVRQRDIVAILIAGGSNDARGERSVATGPPTSSGVVTVSPAFSATIDTAVTYQVWDADGPHPDLIDRMIDLALREDCWRWVPTPLTYVPGGDVGEELSVSSNDLVNPAGTIIWTGTNATPTLPSLAPPDEFVRRVLRVTASATSGYMESQAMDADVENRPGWHIQALVRAGPGADAGRIVLRDLTNGADITPDTALTRTREAFALLESAFTIPTDCEQIAIRLQCDANTDIADFAWVQAWPDGQTRFSLPPRIASKSRVGSVFTLWGDTFDQFRPVPWSGSAERRDVAGTGVSLVLTPPPSGKRVWFYEKASFPTITTAAPAAADDDNATWATPEWVIAAAEYEIYKALARRDLKEAPGRWNGMLVDAEIELGIMQRQYGADPMYVSDKAAPTYRATSRV